ADPDLDPGTLNGRAGPLLPGPAHQTGRSPYANTPTSDSTDSLRSVPYKWCSGIESPRLPGRVHGLAIGLSSAGRAGRGLIAGLCRFSSAGSGQDAATA